jgi:LysR family transcriptional regulator, glycine cleavage system transcriptional activator
VHPDVPLDVIGTDSVLDIQAGYADVAICYGRSLPTDGIAEEFLRDTFHIVCSPKLRAGAFKQALGLRGHVLVHSYWTPSDTQAP